MSAGSRASPARRDSDVDAFRNLKLDAPRPDIKLALEYFKKNNHEFHNLGHESLQHGFHVKDKYDNKVYLVRNHEEPENKFTSDEQMKELGSKFVELSQKVKENWSLFVQLEWALRGVRGEEAARELALVVRGAGRAGAGPGGAGPGGAGRAGAGPGGAGRVGAGPRSAGLDGLRLDAGAPLSLLGAAPRLLLNYEHVYVYAAVQTAAVAHLFVQLCRQVGLRISLVFVHEASSPQPIRPKSINFKDPHYSCVGVVTERSDLDSAVDTFISSSTRPPWNIVKVFVQESVIETFKKALAWKYRLRKTGYAEQAKTFNVNVFAFEDKIFLVDFVGKPGDIFGINESRKIIMVESYRTTKELMSLIKDHGVFTMSLWSSDISEANEIAYGVSASIVWINGYGTIEGPDIVSQAYYCKIYKSLGKGFKGSAEEANLLLDLLEKWEVMSLEQRRNVILTAIENYDRQSELSPILEEIKNETLDGMESFAVVEKGMLCVGMEIAGGAVSVGRAGRVEVLRSVLHGAGVLLLGERADAALDSLAYAGVPLVVSQQRADPTGTSLQLYDTKVVYTHFGTIFAN